MAVTFKLKGLDKTLKTLSNYPDHVKQAVDDELTQTAGDIVQDAQILAPVDIGTLRHSIKITRAEPLLKQVSATAEYAAYVEFGTGTKVNIPNAPEGLQQYAMQFKGKGIRQVNLPARPYFFPAWQQHTVGLIKRIKEIIEEEARLA